jgi:putative acetyltransferase
MSLPECFSEKMNITIRPIRKEDNKQMADLIKNIFLEFNLPKEGTAYSDPATNNLYELFQTEKSAYWVAEHKGKILGGCGIFPTNDLPSNHAELVKFYLLPDSRGKGIGRKLLAQSFVSAILFGYEHLYLESVPEFSDAIRLYENTGFTQIDKRLGNSGHFSCNTWMLKNL